jgi:hypothetical protein
MCSNLELKRGWFGEVTRADEQFAGKVISIQTALLDHHVLADDQPMLCHFFQPGENAGDVFVRIDEEEDDGQLTSAFDEMRGLDGASSKEAGDGVKGCGSKDVFFAQLFEDFEMQRAMMPGIAFGEIDGDLNRHNFGRRDSVCHFTTSYLQPPGECRPGEHCGEA